MGSLVLHASTILVLQFHVLLDIPLSTPMQLPSVRPKPKLIQLISTTDTTDTLDWVISDMDMEDMAMHMPMAPIHMEYTPDMVLPHPTPLPHTLSTPLVSEYVLTTLVLKFHASLYRYESCLKKIYDQEHCC